MAPRPPSTRAEPQTTQAYKGPSARLAPWTGLYHAAEAGPHETSVWSLGCSHLYVAFKLVAFVERVRRAMQSAKAAVCLQLPMGTYASSEEIMELGEEGCTICQVSSRRQL